jgi:hypothetical protein
MMVGEVKVQRSDVLLYVGYSEKAQRTGKPSYLEPISQSMQKTVEGLLAECHGALYKGATEKNRTTVELHRG